MKYKYLYLNKTIQGFVLTGSLIVACNPLHADVADSISAKDPFYLQLYGGINKSANENLPRTEFSKYPWAGGFFVGLGKEITSLWGWRAAFRLNHNKSRNVQECESPDTWGWNNMGLFADATFDLTDALAPAHKEKPSPFNLKLFAGVGGAYTFGFPMQTPLSYTVAYSRNSTVGFAMRAGLTATYRVARQWRLGAELSHTIFYDRFNGVKSGFPLDERSNLKVGVTYLFGKRKKHPPIMEPVIYDNRLRDIPALPFLIPGPEETKVRRITGRAFLDFPVNETVIYPQYRRNPEELQRIRATVDSALFDTGNQITHIYLHGYASPESPYSNNTRLAKGRTAALKDYMKRHYKMDETVFQSSYTPEDWANLRSFIADGNRTRVKDDIWYETPAISETPEAPDYVLQNRDELLAVIDRDMDPDEKEALLKKVDEGRPYRWLLKHVYPGLRHTDYIIEYVVRPYETKDGRRLIYTHPEALSLEEMYRVAQTYEEGSDEWLDALLIAAKQYPEDEAANLNAACGCVMAKRMTDARRYLQKAGTSAQAGYLKDVVDAMEGKKAWKMENGKVIITGR